MGTPNVVGYVTEFIEERPIEARKDHLGNILELIPGETQVLLKLKLKNTFGEVREILVDGPADLSAFFNPELRSKPCELCEGRGARVPGRDDATPCSACKGSGRVPV